MFKNKEFRMMVIISAAFTAVISICGYALCGISAFLISVLSGGVLTVIFAITTKKRYEAIGDLNTYLEKVLAGSEVPDILDQEEGELSLLRTNIYKATSALKYQKELLAKDKTALSDAIADISHQLKTPLTSMMVMNDLLKTEEQKDRRIEFLRTQSNQLDRMNWLIQTLLKLSKIDAGTIEMKPEVIRADVLMEEVIKPFEIQMDLKNIRYSCDAADELLKCDRNWTVEAIQNIVKNCIEHLEDGGMLHVFTNDTNIYSDIVIEDNGCGIAEEDLPHIFERFYKGKNAGKDSVGIGLALAKTIVNSQHGDILAESVPGEGTRFSVRFYKTII